MESRYTFDVKDMIAKVELVGRLDANNAQGFQDELKKLSGQQLEKVVFFAKDLEYISSAGLRAIIFAKQKIGSHLNVYLIGANESVLSVIKMSGLDNFLFIQETYTE
jgi:anti-anti-sigma factor